MPNRSFDLKLCSLGGLELKLELVCDKGNEFRIRGFSLGIANRVAKEPLQSIQIASVPSHLDGVANGPLYSGRRGLEGFRHLRMCALRHTEGVLLAALEGL